MCSTDRVIRVLVLHGFAQNIEISRHQTGALRSSFKSNKNIVFDYMNAPYELSSLVSNNPYLNYNELGFTIENRYSWWYSQQDGSLKHYQGFKQTIDSLRKQWLNVSNTYQCNGYDAVIGFSQGACLAGILAAIRECHLNNTLQQLIKDTQYESILSNIDFLTSLQFIISISGFITHDIDLSKLYNNNDKKISIPSFHVIGESDQQVLPERSHQLTYCFNDTRLMTHSGGHMIPLRKEQIKIYKEYIEKQYNNIVNNSNGNNYNNNTVRQQQHKL